MKKIILIITLFSVIYTAAQNIFWDKSFWSPKTTLSQVISNIEKGNDPVQTDPNGFDATTNAIMGKAPLNVISYLIGIEGNSVNKITHDGRTYLFWACASGEIPVIHFLLEKGSKINITDEKGLSPILFTANRGKNISDVINLLLKNGANIHSVSPDGANALLLSCLNVKNIDELNYFTQKGLPINSEDFLGNNAIDYVAKVGNTSLIEELIKRGVNIKKNIALVAAQGYRRHQNNLSFFKFLKRINVDFSVQNTKKENVLHILALHNTFFDVMQYMLNQKTDPQALDNKSNTILINACTINTYDIVKLILNQNIPINHQNKEGVSALSQAVESNHSDIVELLLENGANPFISDQKGRPLTYYLVSSFSNKNEKDFYRKWELLKQYNLNFDSTSADGNNLFHWAVEKNNLALIKKISSLKTDINQKNQDGLTPLHKAIMSAKNTQLIELLVKLGASTKITTDFGETPLDLARENEALKNENIEFLK